ncbi:SpoIIE family protein phosphatase [Streptomyces sp. NPDC057702]|uniref:SpoIIE family protein phosphatase n=1 Tax=unclassified Streptomyces TaxID=2593676 RepID=UPI00368AC653
MGTGVDAHRGGRGADADAYGHGEAARPRPVAPTGAGVTPDAPPGAPAPPPERIRRTDLSGNALAPAAARQFVRTALADWSAHGMPVGDPITAQLGDDAVLLVSELVTNAVVHAGTGVVVRCALEPAEAPEPGATFYAEVTDHHPASALRGQPELGRDPALGRLADGRAGSGLRLVGTIADSWGTIYRRASKSVWFRLPVTPAPPAPPAASAVERGAAGERDAPEVARVTQVVAPAPRRAARHRDVSDQLGRGALAFLAEASDLLVGQFDEDKVALLTGQLLVPRLADWCAVWLQGADAAPCAPWVWHASESRMAELRRQVGERPPSLPSGAGGRAVPWPWPRDAAVFGAGGAALACGLVTGGRTVGTVVIGRGGLGHLPDEVARLFEDLARRVALAVVAARQYTRQARISEVLQRGLLPSGLAPIPGVDTAVVYEPTGDACAGGDFYDVFPAGDGRWCFALGDVCGNGPEAAVVTGLARPVLRLLAREGYGVTEVLDRLNRTLGEKAVEAAASAIAAQGPGESRFLSLLYGELVPYDAPAGEAATAGEPTGASRRGPAAGEGAGPRARRGVRCTLASAGHPLPLLLRADGQVVVRAAPQLLLGVLDEVRYESETFDLLPGETLLCVTDGVTEHRSDRVQFDDDGGLARALATCVGLGAHEVAQRVRTAVHAFAATPPEDDLAMLVLRAAR